MTNIVGFTPGYGASKRSRIFTGFFDAMGKALVEQRTQEIPALVATLTKRGYKVVWHAHDLHNLKEAQRNTKRLLRQGWGLHLRRAFFFVPPLPMSKNANNRASNASNHISNDFQRQAAYSPVFPLRDVPFGSYYGNIPMLSHFPSDIDDEAWKKRRDKHVYCFVVYGRKYKRLPMSKEQLLL